jgi:hypothetical protein
MDMSILTIIELAAYDKVSGKLTTHHHGIPG